MLAWEHLSAVERNPEIVSGAWVFRGTRVRGAALFATLRDGTTVDDFRAWFPGVTRAGGGGTGAYGAVAAGTCRAMKVRFDQGTRVALRRHLGRPHHCDTVYRRGGTTLKHGVLLWHGSARWR
jgi:uncharacterized protein (DUF433 family)